MLGRMTIKNRLANVVLAAGLGLLSMAVSGCGGGGDSCGAAACGGDVTGTWKVTSACLTTSGSPLGMDCPQATASVSRLNVSGTVAYMANMTYTSNVSIGGQVEITIPSSCLTFNGITATCAQLQAAIAADPSSGVQSCTSAGSGCTCVSTVDPSNKSETGTWSTAANVLTETATGGQPGQSDYCVKGSTLTIAPHADMATTMTDLTVGGSITLTMQ